MKRALDILAVLGLFLGCFILLVFVTCIGYVILAEPLVRAVLALIAGYIVSIGLFAWSYDRLVYPFLPWSKQ